MADLADAGMTFTNPLREGDPGIENVTADMYAAAAATPTPAPAATPTTAAPAPPNTGTGTQTSGGPTSTTPMLAGGGVLAALALLTSLALSRRRQP